MTLTEKLAVVDIIVGGREDDRATQAAREALVEHGPDGRSPHLDADHSR